MVASYCFRQDLEARVEDPALLQKHDSHLARTLAVCDSNIAMNETPTGKAWNFVSKMISFQQDMLHKQDANMNAMNFRVVNQDDMVFLAERVFQAQQEFRLAGKPFHVDIGYHYTHHQNMDSGVRTDGLLTHAERRERNIQSNFNGATFGDGIYTCSNAFSYHAFAGGDVGLFVARLKGTTRDYTSGIENDPNAADTIIGRSGKSKEVIVLRSSAQCVSLIQFGSPMIELDNDASMGNAMVHRYHILLQDILDECFNGGKKTLVPLVLPSQVLLRESGTTLAPSVNLPIANTIPREEMKYDAPDCLRQGYDLSQLIEIASHSASDAECTVCLETLDKGTAAVVRLVDCRHKFHGCCIETALAHSKKCPSCRRPVGKPQGSMPSGTMTIEWRSDLTCHGFVPGAIVIRYNIDAGIQKQYHENPGTPYAGTHRTAYLPDNREGRWLLKRLKYAFSCGLTFTIGTSLTTGTPNSVTWSSIHHKTSLYPGVHGYPDDAYFINANEELDALHVPSVDNL